MTKVELEGYQVSHIVMTPEQHRDMRLWVKHDVSMIDVNQEVKLFGAKVEVLDMRDWCIAVIEEYR